MPVLKNSSKDIEKFISWFVQADIQFLDGDVVDYRTSTHEGDMQEDAIEICPMEHRDDWADCCVALNPETVKEIQINSSHAVVLTEHDVIYKIERAHKEKPANPELRCLNEQCESNNGDADALFTNSLVVDEHGKLVYSPFDIDGYECTFCQSEADWEDV